MVVNAKIWLLERTEICVVVKKLIPELVNPAKAATAPICPVDKTESCPVVNTATCEAVSPEIPFVVIDSISVAIATILPVDIPST